MVLGPQGPGRVGRRRFTSEEPPSGGSSAFGAAPWRTAAVRTRRACARLAAPRAGSAGRGRPGRRRRRGGARDAAVLRSRGMGRGWPRRCGPSRRAGERAAMARCGAQAPRARRWRGRANQPVWKPQGVEADSASATSVQRISALRSVSSAWREHVFAKLRSAPRRSASRVAARRRRRISPDRLRAPAGRPRSCADRARGRPHLGSRVVVHLRRDRHQLRWRTTAIALLRRAAERDERRRTTAARRSTRRATSSSATSPRGRQRRHRRPARAGDPAVGSIAIERDRRERLRRRDQAAERHARAAGRRGGLGERRNAHVGGADRLGPARAVRARGRDRRGRDPARQRADRSSGRWSSRPSSGRSRRSRSARSAAAPAIARAGFAGDRGRLPAGASLAAFLAVGGLKLTGVAPDDFVREGNALGDVDRGARLVLARRRLLRRASPGCCRVTLARSAALVGVAISITTIPAAANIGASLAYGDWELGRRLDAASSRSTSRGCSSRRPLTLAFQRRSYVRRMAHHRLATAADRRETGGAAVG